MPASPAGWVWASHLGTGEAGIDHAFWFLDEHVHYRTLRQVRAILAPWFVTRCLEEDYLAFRLASRVPTSHFPGVRPLARAFTRLATGTVLEGTRRWSARVAGTVCGPGHPATGPQPHPLPGVHHTLADPPLFRELRRRGLAIVYTVHVPLHESANFYNNIHKLMCNYWAKSVLRICDALLVHTEGIREVLSDFLEGVHPPIHVTPHGVWRAAGRSARPMRAVDGPRSGCCSSERSDQLRVCTSCCGPWSCSPNAT